MEVKFDTLPENVSEDSPFYTIDLESMDMIEVLFMIEKKYGINIPLTIIAKNDTLGVFIHKINELIHRKQDSISSLT